MSATRTVPSSWPAAAALVALLLFGLSFSKDARAQASSWLYVGGGAARIEGVADESRSVLQVDTGLGTSATHPVVVGGLFRLQGYFGAGTDLAFLSRLVTRGFAKGDFGGGIDVGVYQRWWGPNSTGGIGNIVLGAPWGLTLLGGATVGSGEQRLYFASVGIDLARLTVHRHSGLSWFANPMRSPRE
jgi:hypothetical protein